MCAEHLYAVYILASGLYGTLYVGVTNDVICRVDQHRRGVLAGFTKRYGVTRLVYYEHHRSIEQAIAREKQIKKWRREWKTNLIERENPQWLDLYANLMAENKRRTMLPESPANLHLSSRSE